MKLAVFREPGPTKIVLSEISGRAPKTRCATPIGVPIRRHTDL
jgi:hypothetical protein